MACVMVFVQLLPEQSHQKVLYLILKGLYMLFPTKQTISNGRMKKTRRLSLSDILEL